MKVRFWGTRGSIAVPGPTSLRYGGNTPCVEVRTDDGTLLIFDCGTGARNLGLALARGGPVRAHLFFTHTHADHIQGLPFFVPAFMAGSHLTVYGPAGIDRSFPQAVGGLMEYAYFPVPMQELPAQVEFVELGEGEFAVGEVRVRTQYLNHTAPCLGYRVESRGATFVYATDHEPHVMPYWRPDRVPNSFELDAFLHPGDAQHAAFFRDADLVVHDSQYTADEYATKTGWGHSPVEYVVDAALAGRARRLMLFHYDPARTDDGVDALLATCRERVSSAGRARQLQVLAAAEGAEITLLERAREEAPVGGPQAPRMPSRARILVVDDEDMVALVLEDVLRDDGYEIMRAASGEEALEVAARESFDLVLLDVLLPGMDGFAVARALRADPRLEGVPIVMLTARNDELDMMTGFSEGVTDYMTKPFAVAQLRARVRSWLTRTGTDVAPP